MPGTSIRRAPHCGPLHARCWIEAPGFFTGDFSLSSETWAVWKRLNTIPGSLVLRTEMTSPPIDKPDEQTLARADLEVRQRRKLAQMLEALCASNPFYRRKLSITRFDPLHDPMDELPFTTRAEIEADQREHTPYGTNLTYPIERYCRFHQTSGTSGQPVRWLDTADSWGWFKTCWGTILRAAGVTQHDRLMFPFSFGPFIGFWAAFEGAAAMGCLCLPAGGMTTSARFKMLIDNSIDVVFCTPTYALRMAETAAADGIDLAGSSVRALIVAGEPGGSIPEVRRRIESAWGARVFDHHGMTEIGSVSFECQPSPGGLHVIESEFIAEVIDPKTAAAVADGQQGELVLTNLGRVGSPLIRYRTGDLVRMSRGTCACGGSFARLEGGILGRADDMFIVRGNNVFPSAVEAVVRQFPDVAEFRVHVRNDGALTQVRLEIEPTSGASEDLAERVGLAVQTALSFRAEVQQVPPNSLPRFEMKAKRFIRERKTT
jgi:phenylacetate-CoA ligase